MTNTTTNRIETVTASIFAPRRGLTVRVLYTATRLLAEGVVTCHEAVDAITGEMDEEKAFTIARRYVEKFRGANAIVEMVVMDGMQLRAVRS